MIIDFTNMFNYQIICNEQLIIGMIHSYSPSLLSSNYIQAPLVLKRKNGGGVIIKAQLVEE